MNEAFGRLRIETLPGIWELGFGTSGTGVKTLSVKLLNRWSVKRSRALYQRSFWPFVNEILPGTRHGGARPGAEAGLGIGIWNFSNRRESLDRGIDFGGLQSERHAVREQTDMEELSSYLNDHLAGSVGALELLDRLIERVVGISP